MGHGGRRRGAGAPKGNLNNLKHGRRSLRFRALATQIATGIIPTDITLDPIALRAYLQTMPQRRPTPTPPTAAPEAHSLRAPSIGKAHDPTGGATAPAIAFPDRAPTCASIGGTAIPAPDSTNNQPTSPEGGPPPSPPVENAQNHHSIQTLRPRVCLQPSLKVPLAAPNPPTASPASAAAPFSVTSTPSTSTAAPASSPTMTPTSSASPSTTSSRASPRAA